MDADVTSVACRYRLRVTQLQQTNAETMYDDSEAESIPARLHEAFDGLLAGCQVLGRDFRYLYMNEAAARHGRRHPGEVVGRPITDVYPGIEQSELFATLRRCMAERVAVQLENEFVYPDGH